MEPSLVPHRPLAPMLAQEVAAPFDDPNFLFEIKWDGYRALLERGGKGHAYLWSRSSRDLGRELPALSAALAEELPEPVLLDGEIVALKDGRPDFERLLRHEDPIVYVVFDLLALRGESLVEFPLRERRARLADKIRPSSRLILSEGVVGAGTSFFKGVQDLGLEGMMAKDLHSLYRPGRRSPAWRKVLNLREGTFPVLALELDDTGTVSALWVRASGERADPIARVAGLPRSERSLLTEMAGPALMDVPSVRRLVRPPRGLSCRIRYRKVQPGGKLRHPVYVALAVDPSAGDGAAHADDGRDGPPPAPASEDGCEASS